MTDTCSICGRPRAPKNDHGLSTWHLRCQTPGSVECRAVEAAFERGVVHGLDLAKQHAYATAYPDGTAEIQWDAVADAAREELGDDAG